MAVAASEAQVRAFLNKLAFKSRQPRVVGLRAETWQGPQYLDSDGVSFRVALCRSPIEVREQLVELGDDEHLVVLTPVAETDLGGDVLARLAKGRIHLLDARDLILDLFQARALDPRVRLHGWFAEALVSAAPPEGYPPVPTGILDEDTVWKTVLESHLGLRDARPDAVALLRWTLESGSQDRYRAASDDLKKAVSERFNQTAGLVGAAIADVLEQGYGASASALGLACRVLFDERSRSEQEVLAASVRFERFHRQRPLSDETAWRWAEAAEQVVGEVAAAPGGWSEARRVGQDAETILQDVGAIAFAHRSRWLPAGFEQRLTSAAGTLEHAMRKKNAAPAVDAACADVRDHRVAQYERDRVRRLEMAARLVRWLYAAAPAEEPSSIEDAAQRYATDGAFVDLARLSLLGGDGHPQLQAAYSVLQQRVTARREEQNESFARLLAASAACVRPHEGLVPVEQVIASVVAPLVEQTGRAVLFVVLDGLSRPVYHDLLESLIDAGWLNWQPGDDTVQPKPWAAIAAVPSITQLSRTSLLCGALRAGGADDERRGFAAHASLLRVSKPRFAPVLFHKGALTDPDGRGLSDDVRQATASTDQRVVGVVLNAVDDLLFGGEQIRPRWTLDYLPLLDSLLYEARVAGRLVVLVSDHGHLLEDGSASYGREAGQRWRAADAPPQSGEVLVEGPRVLANGQQRVVVPWSEKVRYGGRKNGYHGGVSLQEVILPLAILSSDDVPLFGYVDAQQRYPDWWFQTIADAVSIALPAPRKRPVRKPPAPVTSRPLLEPLELAVSAHGEVRDDTEWIERLLTSEIMIQQRHLAGRVAPADEEIRGVLLALDSRGGKLTRDALSQRLGRPVVRLAGLVAALRRVLNVDGEAILAVEEGDTIVLNRALLEKQFELSA